MNKNKLYLCEVDVDEVSPYYTIMVEASNASEARKKAERIAYKDYGEQEKKYKAVVHEIETLEDVKKYLLL